MSYSYEPTILLVREGAVLPPGLVIQPDTFLPGWQVVKNADNYALLQSMRETNWSFLRLRGGKEIRLMGYSRREILRKGVAQMLTELRSRRFNSMEVTVLVAKRFLGVTFLNISVNLRHFQYNVPGASLGKAFVAV